MCDETMRPPPDTSMWAPEEIRATPLRQMLAEFVAQHFKRWSVLDYQLNELSRHWTHAGAMFWMAKHGGYLVGKTVLTIPVT